MGYNYDDERTDMIFNMVMFIICVATAILGVTGLFILIG